MIRSVVLKLFIRGAVRRGTRNGAAEGVGLHYGISFLLSHPTASRAGLQKTGGPTTGFCCVGKVC